MVQRLDGPVPAQQIGEAGRAGLSMANMAGRFIWSSISEVVGRRPIYMLYLGGGMICYMLLIRPVPRSLSRTGGRRRGPGGHRRGGKDLVMSTRARLVFGWALVGIPLAYGVYETLVKASSLFTG